MQEEIQKESKEVYEVDWILPVHSVCMRKSYQECTHALHACKKRFIEGNDIAGIHAPTLSTYARAAQPNRCMHAKA